MTDQMPSPPAVALLGAGLMGAGMGRSMLRAGLPVRVWNRTAAKAGALAHDGAQVGASPADAVRDAQVIVTILADADSVSAVMTAAIPGLQEGQVWAQASTVGLAGLDQLAGFATEHGLVFVDCPVLGTRQPAEQGALTVFAAGPDAARAAAQPVFDAIGRKTVWLSQDAGAASRLKLVVNSWVLAISNGAAEAVALARGLDLDPQLFLDAVSGGPLDTPYLHLKAGAILAGDYAPNFTAAMAGKDARLIVAAAGAAGLRMDVAAACAERLRRAVDLGHGDQDMAATYFACFDGAAQ
jgi:3-hydroxyisobutyrate dehydrogenase